MPIPLSHITEAVNTYLQDAPDVDLTPLIELLNAGGDATSRKHLPGHVTCSAAVINDAGQILHIQHNALGRLLLPGGHCEPEDTTLMNAALREVEEETGIQSNSLEPWNTISSSVIEIDIHPIAANPEKSEPAHWHADFRHAFKLTTHTNIALQAEEVSGFAWLEPQHMKTGRLSQRISSLMAAAR